MFDLIFALVVIPIFVAASIGFRSWLRFNQRQKMRLDREEELEIVFGEDAEEAYLDKNLIRLINHAN